jgi:endonuclease/exonuclease/phosphatase family metal-dependent hydrolase
MAIALLTWNMQGGSDNWPVLSSVLRSPGLKNFDIICCLQEMTAPPETSTKASPGWYKWNIGTQRSGKTFYLAYREWLRQPPPFGNKRCSLAILTNIKPIRSFDIPSAEEQYRPLLCVELTQVNFQVATIHARSMRGGTGSLLDVEALLTGADDIRRHPSPMIVAGDFNCEPNQLTHRLASHPGNPWAVVHTNEFTHVSDRVYRNIDYMVKNRDSIDVLHLPLQLEVWSDHKLVGFQIGL